MMNSSVSISKIPFLLTALLPARLHSRISLSSCTPQSSSTLFYECVETRAEGGWKPFRHSFTSIYPHRTKINLLRSRIVSVIRLTPPSRRRGERKTWEYNFAMRNHFSSALEHIHAFELFFYLHLCRLSINTINFVGARGMARLWRFRVSCAHTKRNEVLWLPMRRGEDEVWSGFVTLLPFFVLIFADFGNVLRRIMRL